MTDRDTFAAAALTGLLAQGDDGSFTEGSYVRAAYRWADAMLREREPIPKEKRAEVSFTLTDAEREAVEVAIRTVDWTAQRHTHAATLRGLLARTK